MKCLNTSLDATFERKVGADEWGLKGMSHLFPPRGGAKTAENAVVDYHLDPEH